MIIKHLHNLHVAEDLWGFAAIATLSHYTLCLAYWTVSATLHFKLIRFCSNLDVGQNTVQSGHYCLVGYIKAHQRLFLILVGGTLTHLEHLSCTKCTFKAFGRPCCQPVKGVINAIQPHAAAVATTEHKDKFKQILTKYDFNDNITQIHQVQLCRFSCKYSRVVDCAFDDVVFRLCKCTHICLSWKYNAFMQDSKCIPQKTWTLTRNPLEFPWKCFAVGRLT